jgi:hypothetical protein
VLEDNDPASIVREIHVQQSRALEILGSTTSVIQRRKATLAHAALTWLADIYQTELNKPEIQGVPLTDEEEDQMDQQEDQEDQENNQEDGQDGQKSWIRRVLS